MAQKTPWLYIQNIFYIRILEGCNGYIMYEKYIIQKTDPYHVNKSFIIFIKI